MDISVNRVGEIVKEQLQAMLGAGCAFADARLYDEDSDEDLLLRDGNLEDNSGRRERGIGVRVLKDNAWGFAATADLTSIPACFGKALANSRAAAKLTGFPKDMGKAQPVKGQYRPPVKQDPFEVPLAERLAFMKKIDALLVAGHVAHRTVSMNLQRRKIFYWNSEGTEIDRWQLNTFGSMNVIGLDPDGGLLNRSYDLAGTGDGTRGFEWLSDDTCFAVHAERIKQELSELIAAPRMAPGRHDVILLPGQAWLQVHETIGHALELDRILGYELSFAGGSHVKPEMIGTLRYGSERLNCRAGTSPNSPGTFGYDDEGTPQRDYLLIDKGILVNVLSSRTDLAECTMRAGRPVVTESGSAARACAFYRPPIDRMTNISIDPGSDGTLDDIVRDTADGVILDNAISWSIGSNREHFHFGCEIAWEVKDGRRTRVLKRPQYYGHTLEFWNSLDKVGDPRTHRLIQIATCGKGEPNQLMELGHAVPVLRFHNVATGEKE